MQLEQQVRNKVAELLRCLTACQTHCQLICIPRHGLGFKDPNGLDSHLRRWQVLLLSINIYTLRLLRVLPLEISLTFPFW